MLANAANSCHQRSGRGSKRRGPRRTVLVALILAQLGQCAAGGESSIPNPLDVGVDLEAKLSALKDAELGFAQQLIDLAPDRCTNGTLCGRVLWHLEHENLKTRDRSKDEGEKNVRL